MKGILFLKLNYLNYKGDQLVKTGNLPKLIFRKNIHKLNNYNIVKEFLMNTPTPFEFASEFKVK